MESHDWKGKKGFKKLILSNESRVATLLEGFKNTEKKRGVGKMVRMQPLLTLRCASSSSVSLVSRQGCLSLFPGLFTERWQEPFAQHFAVCRTSIFPA